MSGEPKITINGFELTEAQAMSLRVALNDFQISMIDTNALGEDDVGKAIRKGYSDRLAEVAKFMTAEMEGQRSMIQRLQNSPLTSWIWRYWQNQETGQIKMIPFWRSPGRRWWLCQWKR